jgi:hypothetical protein
METLVVWLCDIPLCRFVIPTGTTGRVRWYPTQAKLRLESGTQPLQLVQGVGVKLPCRDYFEFPMYRQQKLGAPFKPYFGLSGIPQHSTSGAGRDD